MTTRPMKLNSDLGATDHLAPTHVAESIETNNNNHFGQLCKVAKVLPRLKTQKRWSRHVPKTVRARGG